MFAKPRRGTKHSQRTRPPPQGFLTGIDTQGKTATVPMPADQLSAHHNTRKIDAKYMRLPDEYNKTASTRQPGYTDTVPIHTATADRTTSVCVCACLCVFSPLASTALTG